MSAFSTHGEYCLCGIHVHKGAFIAGCSMLVINTLNAFTALEKLLHNRNDQDAFVQHSTIGAEMNSPATAMFSLVVGVFSAICCGIMLYGNRTLQPKYYYPHLLTEIISCSLLFISTILLVLGGLMSTAVRADAFKHGTTGYTPLLLMGILIGIIGFIRLYFSYTIVKQSQRLIRMQTAEYIQGTGMKEAY